MSGAKLIAYRDRLGVRSEVGFLTRQYAAFERLRPVWVGRRRDEAFAELGQDALILGRNSWVGDIERELFKQTGRFPSTPDLRALAPRLVHAQFGRGGALALPLARALKAPLVVTFHGGDATKDAHYRAFPPSIFRLRLAALQREAALFLCVSGFIRDRLLARGFPAEKLRIHHLGVEISPEWGPTGEGGAPYVLFAGRFVEKKGAATLIEAVRRVQAQGRRLRLVIVGEGPLESELRRAAASLEGVEFRGWLPNAEVHRLMRDSLAFAAPSHRAASGDEEGLPTVVLEAMAAGAPVIGSRHAGIAEAVEEGVTGFLTPERDPDALAAAMLRLMDEEGLRACLGASARAAAAARFDMQAQSRRLEAMLLAVADARRVQWL